MEIFLVLFIILLFFIAPALIIFLIAKMTEKGKGRIPEKQSIKPSTSFIFKLKNYRIWFKYFLLSATLTIASIILGVADCSGRGNPCDGREGFWFFVLAISSTVACLSLILSMVFYALKKHKSFKDT